MAVREGGGGGIRDAFNGHISEAGGAGLINFVFFTAR